MALPKEKDRPVSKEAAFTEPFFSFGSNPGIPGQIPYEFRPVDPLESVYPPNPLPR